MPFWQCHYHVIWATKNRAPIITPMLEALIIESAQAKSAALECPILAINMVEDHVHVAVSILPKIPVAEWVRNIKGITAHEINQTLPDLPERFRWQQGYGVLSVGLQTLPIVIAYIERQKEHHAQQTLDPYWERIDD